MDRQAQFVRPLIDGELVFIITDRANLFERVLPDTSGKFFVDGAKMTLSKNDMMIVLEVIESWTTILRVLTQFGTGYVLASRVTRTVL